LHVRIFSILENAIFPSLFLHDPVIVSALFLLPKKKNCKTVQKDQVVTLQNQDATTRVETRARDGAEVEPYNLLSTRCNIWLFSRNIPFFPTNFNSTPLSSHPPKNCVKTKLCFHFRWSTRTSRATRRSRRETGVFLIPTETPPFLEQFFIAHEKIAFHAAN
jgi:hypothetical protein